MSAKPDQLTRAEQIADAVPYCRQMPGENGRVFVPSRHANQPPYLCDVDEHDGTGWCPCRDFETRHQPYLNGKHATEGYSPKRRCFHIEVAIEYLHKLDADRRNGVVPP